MIVHHTIMAALVRMMNSDDSVNRAELFGRVPAAQPRGKEKDESLSCPRVNAHAPICRTRSVSGAGAGAGANLTQ